MKRHIWLIVSSCVLSGPIVAAASANERMLARARQLYNSGNQDAAIAAAEDARNDTKVASAAAVVLARAYLERFRLTADAKDLEAAREALRSVQPERLSARDRLDLAVGFGEALYLEGAYGAAAEIFEPLLDAAPQLGPRARERVIDWWASALDAEARMQPPADRVPYYRRIVDKMERELERYGDSGVASYWLAAAALGMGDVMRAWQAAVAGWVRASLSPEVRDMLRGDLDRLVLEAIIPDRVRMTSAKEVASATAGMRSEWELVKQRWK